MTIDRTQTLSQPKSQWLFRRMLPENSEEVWRDGLRKISEAMDGRSEALMDELVAFFRRPSRQTSNT
jgi:hypothetical protein